jgi:hypothetical protein
MVEFAVILLVLLMMTMGLIDTGRAFFQYNALSSAARFGARWGGVVGGSCILQGVKTNDWCSKEVAATGQNFWQLSGNVPLQGNGTACPSATAANLAKYYYTVSTYDLPTSTTIVGAIARHFDTSNSTTNTSQGGLAAIDLTKLYACIQTTNTNKDQSAGDYVSVQLYYRFTPVSPILSRTGFNLVASSQYEVE